MGFNSNPVCKGCNKAPQEIREYIFEARMEGITPEQFVAEYERPTPDGNFYCTNCYVKAGMPTW